MEIILTESQKNKIKNHIPISCIYIIRCKINGKVYIGETLNFRKRISEYRALNPNGSNRPIKSAMRKYGTDNFSISILKEDVSENLNALESEFIHSYDSANPEKGYNITSGDKGIYALGCSPIARALKSVAHRGKKESNITKRKKSNIIIAISDDEFIVADSAKLFGAYINKSKDLIKNGLRQPSMISGYHVFYDDYYKRQEIRNKMMNKRSIRNHDYMKKTRFLRLL